MTDVVKKPDPTQREHLVRFREKNRIITICFTWNWKTEEVKYGACIWRRMITSDSFNKKGHRHTALKRLREHPVEKHWSPPDPDMNIPSQYVALTKQIRHWLFKHSVCCTRHIPTNNNIRVTIPAWVAEPGQFERIVERYNGKINGMGTNLETLEKDVDVSFQNQDRVAQFKTYLMC